MNADECAALGLYAIGARDWCDFLEMIVESDITDAALEILKQMLEMKGRPNTDDELNALLLPSVEREIQRRLKEPHE